MESGATGKLIIDRSSGRALTIGASLIIVLGVLQAAPNPTGPRAIGVWLTAFLSVASLLFVLDHPYPFLILIAGLSGAGMEALLPNGPGMVAAVAAIATAGARLEAIPGRMVASVIGLAFLSATLLPSHHLTTGNVVSIALGLAFTYLAVSGIRRLRQEQRRTEELLQEVLANRDAQIRAAALDERSRLAREMHDVLAHTLSALAVQLEGARMLVEQQSGDPAALAAVERSARLAREGLAEARRAVGALRGEQLPGPDLLPRLAEEFERDTAVPCRLEIEGRPIVLSAEARLALYRIAQEALTNVRKHADASCVEIGLRYAQNGTELTVENRGTARTSSLTGGGFGLNGMKERAELLGGRLEAGPTRDGFRVHLWLPV
jgi:signal transduction histidine kinase